MRIIKLKDLIITVEFYTKIKINKGDISIVFTYESPCPELTADILNSEIANVRVQDNMLCIELK